MKFGQSKPYLKETLKKLIVSHLNLFVSRPVSKLPIQSNSFAKLQQMSLFLDLPKSAKLLNKLGQTKRLCQPPNLDGHLPYLSEKTLQSALPAKNPRQNQALLMQPTQPLQCRSGFLKNLFKEVMADGQASLYIRYI